MMKANNRLQLRSTHLAWCVALACSGMSETAQSRDYFNPALLEVNNPSSQGADLAAFEDGEQAAGIYRVDIVINNQLVDTRDITFRMVKEGNGEAKLQPCLSAGVLQSYGVKTALFPQLNADAECANLAAIPQALAEFLFSSQKLLLSIPQAALSAQARGYVAPELWDEGINALLLNYSVSGNNTFVRNGQNTNSQYANLRPGINYGAWRLRNYTTWNRDSDGKDRWDTVYTYAQRDVVALKSQMTLGDSSTPADVFDSIPFRGGQLASDDDMLPDSLKGYAPVVRGIARTNAQVIIRQGGYVIYQSYVAPGAFEITDMYPTGGSGDLFVTIKEADGSEQYLVVPFASVPVLQREGRLKYSLTGGEYRSYSSSVEKTPLAQGTAIYGLPHGFTIYGGLQESSKYQSLALGMGKNLGDIGAISTDVTQGWSTPKGGLKTDGQSWRVRYSKNFTDSGTNFAIAGYRYSTSGFYSMQEILDTYSDSSFRDDRRRNRAEMTLSQALGKSMGAVSLSAIREDYWNINKTMESYGASYNNAWNSVSYSLNYTWSKNSTANGSNSGKTYTNDQLVSLNISVPLSNFLPNSWANYNMNTSKQGNTTHNIGVSGIALPGNALSWNVQQGYGTNGVGYTGNMNADYRGTYGEALAGYSYDQHSQRLNYGLSGGVLAHSDGVTLAQPFGETIALVKAPGAASVGVLNQNGVKTDYRGYTVVSNMTPFRKNDISFDTSSMPDNVELELTTKTVVPTRGAVVRAVYQANVGQRALINLRRSNGEPVPFGAIVSMNNKDTDNHGFIVGDGGQVYLTGQSNKLDFTVKWGEDATQICQVNTTLPEAKMDASVMQLDAVCR
ncbi:MAG TPA: fimbria/pilus outer membrane usher protein [Buttiauxella sp.]|uniref:fimbria/pilus outer membrane usher protein n=1 Tax=Buttiauxella sp. TaxID=1972222 RepID=UPI002B4A98E6|nr:fimbria/pilus outer membrane usher protein [Buttiauxella sp.]HKM95725.1 fimbria/pilus outer membrane usher protein [Buttiauxella sp.]HKN04828.1 fimbria/pilus outer membrane usher protein [Buttiauxella sp.]